jgi:hypothetical protein
MAKKQTIVTLSSAQLLKSDHPLHKGLVKFCGDKEVTKRQASKFLAANPSYRDGRYDTVTEKE